MEQKRRRNAKETKQRCKPEKKTVQEMLEDLNKKAKELLKKKGNHSSERPNHREIYNKMRISNKEK